MLFSNASTHFLHAFQILTSGLLFVKASYMLHSCSWKYVLLLTKVSTRGAHLFSLLDICSIVHQSIDTRHPCIPVLINVFHCTTKALTIETHASLFLHMCSIIHQNVGTRFSCIPDIDKCYIVHQSIDVVFADSHFGHVSYW